MLTLSSFIVLANDKIKQLGEGESWGSSTRMIIGNESCDLDSVASSLAFSHYWSTVVPTTHLILPFLNCLREDLSLRQDIVWLLNHLEIDSSQLLFLSEVTLSELPNLHVTLVDHNVPDELLRPYVDEIIDHHVDADTINCSRTIEPVGSCSTLVAEKLLNSKDYNIPPDVATFLLAAILIDTGNLKLGCRVTDKDKDMATKLEVLVPLTADQLYYNVLTAREDVSDLSALQILRKDFKRSEVGNFSLGFSSMTLLVTDLINTRTDVVSDLELFATQHKLHVLVLLSIQMKPLRRQIALYQPPQLPPGIPTDLVDSIAATLENDSHLQVERIGEGMFDGIIMEQGNTSFSRKQILPLITDCLAYSAGTSSLRIQGFPRSETVYLDDNLPSSPPVIECEVFIKRDDNIVDPDDEYNNQLTPSQQGSLLQLESISARLGESMDSFALAQDSDEEKGQSSSPQSASLSNLADRSLSSIDEKYLLLPAPPLEPEIIVSSPAVLPQESDMSQIPEYTSQEESEDMRTFRLVTVGGEERRISLKLIEPYKYIVQHGGYTGNEKTAVIVICSFYLPPKNLPNYPQVISQLFFYVLSVLDKIVVDDYVIVYLHSGAPRNSMPSIQWFHRFYRMIDRRLRKNLKELNIVHPTFWVKTMLRLVRPFISRKFYRKVSYIESLRELQEYVELDSMLIPEAVRNADLDINPAHYRNTTSSD